MQTDSWIERVIIQRLAVHDRRYKHNYRSRQESTPDFVVGCGYIETMDRGDDIRASVGQSMAVEHHLEPAVKDALTTLRQQDLLTNVGERPRGSLFSDDALGATAQWELTEEGLTEAAAVNAAYSTAMDAFEEQYDELTLSAANELVTLSKQYGVIPGV